MNAYMKKELFTLTFILIMITSYAQFSYPKGAYLSFEEIVRKSPSGEMNLKIERRSKGEIKMNGGNDFQLLSVDNSIPKKTLKKDLFAYSNGDTLFINCLKYKVQPWYANIISDGKYLVFMGGISQDSEIYKKQMQMGVAFGAIGGGIAGAKLALMRFPYAIEKETNKLFPVDEDSMPELLKMDEELLRQYESEGEKNVELFIRYLEQLNKKYQQS